MKKILIVLFILFGFLNLTKAENFVSTGVIDICDLNSLCSKIENNEFLRYQNFGKNFIIKTYPSSNSSTVYLLSYINNYFRASSFSIQTSSGRKGFETSVFTLKDLDTNKLYNIIINQNNRAYINVLYDNSNTHSNSTDYLDNYVEPVKINYYSGSLFFVFHSKRNGEETKYQGFKIDVSSGSPVVNVQNFCDFDSIKLSDGTCESIGSSLTVDSNTLGTLTVDQAGHTLLFGTKNFVSLIPDRYYEPLKSKTNFFVDYNTNFIDNGFSMQQGKYIFPWFYMGFDTSVDTYGSLGLDYSGNSVIYENYTIFPDGNGTNDVILNNVFGLEDMNYGSGVNQGVIFNRDNYKYKVSFFPMPTLSGTQVISKDYTKLYYEEYQVENTDLQSSSVLQNNGDSNSNNGTVGNIGGTGGNIIIIENGNDNFDGVGLRVSFDEQDFDLNSRKFFEYVFYNGDTVSCNGASVANKIYFFLISNDGDLKYENFDSNYLSVCGDYNCVFYKKGSDYVYWNGYLLNVGNLKSYYNTIDLLDTYELNTSFSFGRYNYLSSSYLEDWEDVWTIFQLSLYENKHFLDYEPGKTISLYGLFDLTGSDLTYSRNMFSVYVDKNGLIKPLSLQPIGTGSFVISIVPDGNNNVALKQQYYVNHLTQYINSFGCNNSFGNFNGNFFQGDFSLNSTCLFSGSNSLNLGFNVPIPGTDFSVSYNFGCWVNAYSFGVDFFNDYWINTSGTDVSFSNSILYNMYGDEFVEKRAIAKFVIINILLVVYAVLMYVLVRQFF